jgi:hypothetical protein
MIKDFNFSLHTELVDCIWMTFHGTQSHKHGRDDNHQKGTILKDLNLQLTQEYMMA